MDLMSQTRTVGFRPHRGSDLNHICQIISYRIIYHCLFCSKCSCIYLTQCHYQTIVCLRMCKQFVLRVQKRYQNYQALHLVCMHVFSFVAVLKIYHLCTQFCFPLIDIMILSSNVCFGFLMLMWFIHSWTMQLALLCCAHRDQEPKNWS